MSTTRGGGQGSYGQCLQLRRFFCWWGFPKLFSKTMLLSYGKKSVPKLWKSGLTPPPSYFIKKVHNFWTQKKCPKIIDAPIWQFTPYSTLHFAPPPPQPHHHHTTTTPPPLPPPTTTKKQPWPTKQIKKHKSQFWFCQNTIWKKCKLWGRPPPPFWKKFTFWIFFYDGFP